METQNCSNLNIVVSLPDQPVFVPTEKDVLSGKRGKSFNRHPGNVWFTNLAHELKDVFQGGTTAQRHEIACFVESLMKMQGRRALRLVRYCCHSRVPFEPDSEEDYGDDSFPMNTWIWVEENNFSIKIKQKIRDTCAYVPRRKSKRSLPPPKPVVPQSSSDVLGIDNSGGGGPDAILEGPTSKKDSIPTLEVSNPCLLTASLAILQQQEISNPLSRHSLDQQLKDSLKFSSAALATDSDSIFVPATISSSSVASF